MADSIERSTVQVDLGERSYEIEISTGGLDTLAETLDAWSPASEVRSAFILTDRNLVDTHAQTVCRSLGRDGWRCDLAVVEPGERTKSLAVVADLYDKLIEMRADRKTVLVAVGGGVVGDCGGFVASSYLRGIPFVQVPTSLLAQVDSSVGGKVGVNHPQGKNLIGAFKQPLGVFIDTVVLDSLPERDYRSGLAEVVKYGVILDADFFESLENNIDGINSRTPQVLRHIIARCCELKAQVVSEDECETKGLRAVLNYGHTFCHAFEALSGYGTLMHGEAVGIGMIYASRLAERLGRIDAAVTERQRRLLEALGLPVALPNAAELSADAILESMRLDKKTEGGKLRFVLPSKLGRVEVVKDVPEEIVREVIETLASR